MALIAVPDHQQRGPQGGKYRAEGDAKTTGMSRGKRKFKSPIAPGAYGNSPSRPHWSHNMHNGRFWANAAVNNPAPAGAAVATAGAAGLASQRGKMNDKNKRRSDTAVGAAAAGVGTQVGGQKKKYRDLRIAQQPASNTDWADPKDIRNPAKTLPSAEKKKFNEAKSMARRAQAAAPGEAGKRAWTKTFNENFPEGYKTSKVRRSIASGAYDKKINRATAAAAVVGGAGVYGAHKAREKFKKNLSAFGVEHG